MRRQIGKADQDGVVAVFQPGSLNQRRPHLSRCRAAQGKFAATVAERAPAGLADEKQGAGNGGTFERSARFDGDPVKQNLLKSGATQRIVGCRHDVCQAAGVAADDFGS